MQLSVIIPTWAEADNIGPLVRHLRAHALRADAEIIVVDGGSPDCTCARATAAGADQVLVSPHKGRACQMNHGARQARGEVLYFVHADTLPPESYVRDIRSALRAGFPAGCYRSRFQGGPWLMQINAWMTRFDHLFLRGGDQSLFITRELFAKLQGYREDYWIMEDYEFLRRLRQQAPFRILPKGIRISTRKYEEHNYWRVNWANLQVVRMFRRGASQEAMLHAYRRMLRE